MVVCVRGNGTLTPFRSRDACDVHHRGGFGYGRFGKDGDGVNHKLTIVIVDDHGSNLPVYKRLLTEFPGCHVMCFPDMAAAERICALHAPDIFVIDDAAPETVPMTFDRHFRDHPGLSNALIVLMSAREGALPDQSRRAGVDVFLPKPVDTKYFMKMLHQAVELRAARADIAAQRVVP